MSSSSVLIIDNGGGSIKAGLMDQETCRMFPNATAKVQKSMQYLISDQMESFHNGSLLQFIRPCDRGYTNNWQCQIEVWTRLFQEHYKIIPKDTSLLLTEPIYNLPSIQRDWNEIVFEYFGFKEYLRRPTMWFSAYGHEKAMFEAGKPPIADSYSCTVVDSGFSFSHVAPFINGRCQRRGVSTSNNHYISNNHVLCVIFDRLNV